MKFDTVNTPHKDLERFKCNYNLAYHGCLKGKGIYYSELGRTCIKDGLCIGTNKCTIKEDRKYSYDTIAGTSIDAVMIDEEMTYDD